MVLAVIASVISCQKDQEIISGEVVGTTADVSTQSRSKTTEKDLTEMASFNTGTKLLATDFVYYCGKGTDFEVDGFQVSGPNCFTGNYGFTGTVRVEFDFEDVVRGSVAYYSNGGPGRVRYTDQFGTSHSQYFDSGRGNADIPFDPAHKIRGYVSFSSGEGEVSFSFIREIACEEEIVGNLLDDDCDGLIDEQDKDGDGWMTYVDCENGPCPIGDCDDTNAAIYPGATEISNNDIDDNCSGQKLTVGWDVSYTGTWPFKNINESIGLTSNADKLLYGDFNGDGTTDVLKADVEGWGYYDGGGETWVELRSGNKPTIPASELLVGDFNGDKTDDLLHATGNLWRVAYSGTGTWDFLRQNTAMKERMHIGDFNGDGIDDVAVISTQRVKYALGGRSDFIRTEGETFKKYGFLIGDLNGDGKDDVFNANGTEWRVLYSGAGTWEVLRTQETTTADLQIGYFHNPLTDGRPTGPADIFKATGRDWRIWNQGKGARKILKNSTVDQVLLGDFNGDGRSDVLRIRRAQVEL